LPTKSPPLLIAHGEQSNDKELAVENGFCSDGWDKIERLPALNPRQRPKEFNQMLRALARTMAKLHNNLTTAYAVFRTGQFFSEEELDDGESGDIARFRAAIDEFQQMDFDDQMAWRDQVQRAEPGLEQLVSKPV
jgi:hypothetical protein